MAFFERADERNKLIQCKICKASCAERSMLTHTMNCIKNPRYKAKFMPEGGLTVCSLVTTHVVEESKLKLHQEFCAKRQQQFVAEYQLETSKAVSSPRTESNSGWNIDEHDQENLLNGITNLNIDSY